MSRRIPKQLEFIAVEDSGPRWSGTPAIVFRLRTDRGETVEVALQVSSMACIIGRMRKALNAYLVDLQQTAQSIEAAAREGRE